MTADMGLRPPLVRGRAFYLERLMMPPGATLHVNVVAQMDGPSTMPVLGQGDWTDLPGPPYEFEVELDQGAVDAFDPATTVTLTAELSDADGEPWFRTSEPVPVEIDGEPVEFRLVRVPSPG
jgi:uncharacterized lipoprotein YbaY